MKTTHETILAIDGQRMMAEDAERRGDRAGARKALNNIISLASGAIDRMLLDEVNRDMLTESNP